MSDALPLFALAAIGCSVALVIAIAGRVWLRGKEMDRSTPPSFGPRDANMVEILQQIDTRLTRLEQAIDSTAIEVERISEAQRFAARSLKAPEAPVAGLPSP